jgi:hypothetical protein
MQLSPPPGDVYNGVISLGDVDGDGYRDFLTGPTYQGQTGLSAVSGRTHQRLWTVANPAPGTSWGYSIATELDVNGDGRPDVVVSAPFEFEPTGGGGGGTVGVIYAYDHLGQLIHRTFSREPFISWGPVVARLGDYDGDGCEDYLTGIGEPTTAGGADVVSGRTGLRLFRVVGPQPGDYLGTGVAGCGDLDGDGLPDIALGGGHMGAPGSVQTFSSRTGQRLHAWYSGANGDFFGEMILGTLDLDQDGITDIVASNLNEPVTPGSQWRGAIHVFSGRDGSSMMRFTDTSGGQYPGLNIMPIPMPNAAGSVFPRFLGVAGTWGFDPVNGYYRSRLYMFEGGPDGVRTIGGACAGTLGNEPRIGLRSLDATRTRVTVSGAEPGMLSLLVLGATQPALPQFDLQALGFTGCTLHPAVDEIGVFIPGTSGPVSGYAYHDFLRGTVAGPVPPGLVVFGQWVVLGSGSHWPGGTTAALRWYLR